MENDIRSNSLDSPCRERSPEFLSRRNTWPPSNHYQLVWDGHINYREIIYRNTFLMLIRYYAIPLLFGLASGLMFANVYPDYYDNWLSYESIYYITVSDHKININFCVNEVLMSLFFALATKELVEAFRENGSMHPINKKIFNILFATLGGILGPISIFFILYFLLDLDEKTFSSWGIPTATDISIAWVCASVTFTKNHPAITYLLLLAVVDDAIGMVIIATVYSDPETPFNWYWLFLCIGSIGVCYLFNYLKIRSWIFYILIPGVLSWIGLFLSNLNPVVCLCQIIFFIPDLHRFEKVISPFVDIVVLFLFGFVNGGIKIETIGYFSLTIFLSLFIGKTLGIFILGITLDFLGYKIPEGITKLDLFYIGIIASAGLTVSLFIAGQALKSDPVLQDEAKLGALLSIVTPIFAFFIKTIIGYYKYDQLSNQ